LAGLLIPAGILVACIGGEMMMPAGADDDAAGRQQFEAACMAIPAMSLPAIGGRADRPASGAPARPAVAGASPAAIGGTAATLYAFACTDDSPLFVATWYTDRDRRCHRDRRAGGSKLRGFDFLSNSF